MNSFRADILARTWLYLAVLLPTVVMLPVLLWPHYGLFSDAGQAIAFPRAVLEKLPASLSLLRPLEDGRWNPLFHGLTIFVYAVAPDSPRALYAAQWLMFGVSSVTIAWLVAKVTGSRCSGLLGVLLFCTSSSVFENFYTLDKVEPRITMFSSLLVASLVGFLLLEVKTSLRWWGFALTQALLGIWLVFSKETGAYLAAALAGTWVACLLNPQWGAGVRVVFARAMIVNGAVVIAFVALFKLLSSGMSYRYVSYDVTWTLLARNVSYYLVTSPELFIGLVCALYWCARALWRRLPGPSGPVQAVLVFLSFCELSYFLGICLWRWPLDYYLLPAHYMAAVLVPVSLWEFVKVWPKATRGPVLRVATSAAAIGWCGLFAFRSFLGGAIYTQDAVKDDLAEFLSSPAWYGQRFVLTLSHPDSAEIGERLEFFINRNRSAGEWIELYNFWEPPSGNRQDLERFRSAAGVAPDEGQLSEVARHVDQFVAWQFGTGPNYSGRDHERPWNYRFIRAGDILVVPTGSPHFRLLRARGLQMYGRTARQFLRQTPLQLVHLGGVRRGPAFASLGWDLFRIEGLLEKEESGGDYSIARLLALNAEADVISDANTRALLEDHVYPQGGLLLGSGWHDLERASRSRFRWMGESSEVVLTRLVAGTCTISADVEPLLTADSQPFSLVLRVGSDQTEFPLQGRDTLTFTFRSSGSDLQVLNVLARGGALSPPPGDSRLLKVRAFSLRLSHCVGAEG